MDNSEKIAPKNNNNSEVLQHENNTFASLEKEDKITLKNWYGRQFWTT